MNLTDYVTLGRSGLKVSPLCLGTMTFGEDWGWGTTESLHRISALQLEYSLIERTIEREHIPAAQEFGLGVCPWAPLGSGLLTGKYKRDFNGGKDGRLSVLKGSGQPGFEKLFTEHNWAIVDALLEVSQAVGKSPAQVALNWVVNRPGITSTIIGATKLAQLQDLFAAIEFLLPAEALAKLERCSSLDPTAHPYLFFTEAMQAMVHGSVPVRAWSRQ